MNHFSVETLKKYCYDVMVARGVDEYCAEAVAEVLLDADVCGPVTHGCSRLPIYMQRIDAGVVSPKNNITVLQEGPSTLAIDAGNSLGAAAGKLTMEKCIEKAKETGACFATVKNSNHFGAAAYYAKMAIEQDMIAFVCANLKGKIAPFGAAEPYMGTNPICIGAPSNGRPVILDMAPSVVAMGKLITAEKLGKKIPLGWALDKDGNPTDDPHEGRAGSLIPAGGPKGSGLAIFADILSGILAGAGFGTHMNDLYDLKAPQGIGHFMGVIDIKRFMDPKDFRAKVTEMSGEIKALKVAPGFSEILMPGEREIAMGEEVMEKGIDIPDPVYKDLVELGKPYGLTL